MTKGRTTVECDYCGEEIDRINSRISDDRYNYCNRLHMSKGRKARAAAYKDAFKTKGE